MLTLEEQERRAYISGNTQLADALDAVGQAVASLMDDHGDDGTAEDIQDVLCVSLKVADLNDQIRDPLYVAQTLI
jgi:hypothetical protein